MRKFTIPVVLMLMLVVLVSWLTAQEKQDPKTAPKIPPKTATVPEPVKTAIEPEAPVQAAPEKRQIVTPTDNLFEEEKPVVPPVMKSAFVLICDSSPGMLIVLDDSGRWLSRVKEAEIKFTGGAPTIKCLLYEGLFRPSQPDVKTWKLSQVKTVSESEFQKLVDQLQSDPEAVRKSLVKEAD